MICPLVFCMSGIEDLSNNLVEHRTSICSVKSILGESFMFHDQWSATSSSLTTAVHLVLSYYRKEYA